MAKQKTKGVQERLSDIIGGAGISYDGKDILLIIAVTDQFRRSGYTLTYDEVATFLTNKKNRKMIKEQGLTKTIEAMASMKLGTIKRPKTPGRNEQCPCQSGNKYKRCCISKRK